jgi:flagellar hook-associated protein 1 FlgK
MSTFGGILSVARTAIAVHQTAMQVTSHNIANAETPGYTRQRAMLQENWPAVLPQGIIGTGVMLSDVTQIRDTLLDASFRRESSAASGFGLRRDLLGQVEAVFREPTDDGLAATLDQFWSGWGDLANNPLNSTTRAIVRQRGEQVATALRGYNQRLDEVAADTGLRLQSSVGQMNEYARQVAELNTQIVAMEVGGTTAGDLRDARNRLIDGMATIAPVETIARGDGSLAVVLNGQTLVDGSTHKSLALGGSAPAVRVSFAGSTDPLPMSGGEMGAMLQVLNRDIPAARARLDELAGGVVTAVNDLHRTGWSPGTEPGAPPAPPGWTGSNVDFFDPAGTTAATIGLSAAVAGSDQMIASGTTYGGAADNGLALQMAGLRDAKVLGGAPPTTSLAMHFRDTVTGIAMAAQSVGNSATVHETMAAQAEVRRQSVSGVSTDEELVSLMKHQQAYVAATRIISAVDEMMQSLLSIV